MEHLQQLRRVDHFCVVATNRNITCQNEYQDRLRTKLSQAGLGDRVTAPSSAGSPAGNLVGSASAKKSSTGMSWDKNQMLTQFESEAASALDRDEQ